MTETGSNSLADLRLPELKKMAAGMGIKGTSVMRKGDLIAAISGGVNVSARADAPTRAARTRKKTESEPQLPVEAPENPGSGNVRDNARTEAEPEALADAPSEGSACPHCTFLNAPGSTDCDVCGLPLH